MLWRGDFSFRALLDLVNIHIETFVKKSKKKDCEYLNFANSCAYIIAIFIDMLIGSKRTFREFT